MQSVEAEDLFENKYSSPSSVMSPHTATFSLHLPCRIPPLPRWSLASQVDTTPSFLHQVPLLIHTCYMSRLHSEFGS
jgi:hypothetical protein